jgi:RHS repeat-associated protein
MHDSVWPPHLQFIVFDANGNTTTKTDSTGTTNYAWDFDNRLTNVTLPVSGGTVSYRYDPLGRRIEKISPTATSIFAYDGDNLIEETNSSGGAVARYAQTENVDEPLAMLRSSTTSYYHADGLGSVTSLSNGAGALAQTYGYDSFGKQLSATGSLTNPFQYTARELDSESGLYFYRARHYDPTIGRFLSEDPLRFSGGTNFYAYVSNRSVDFVDAFGLSPTSGNDCFKKCYGEARVIGAGKAGTGAFGAPNLPGTLAIIPTQFTGTNGATPRAYGAAKGKLRPLIGQIGVAIANPDTGEPLAPFGPITDVIGPTSNAGQLMRDFPGELILEVNGVPESFPRFLPVVVTVPKSLPCPTGTKEVK